MDKNKLKDEIDFRDLLKNPIRLFGWIYPLIILLVVITGIFYIKHLNKISFNETVPVVDRNTIPVIQMKKGAVLPAVDLNILKNAPAESVQKGKELFDKTCASCHGESGMGDGAAGASLNPSPRNFKEKTGWINSRDIVGMYKTLQEGIPNSGMVAYEYIIPEERIDILLYVRTLGDFPEITDDQIQELDLTYGLSKETITSNQIPVKLAIQKLIEEKSNSEEIAAKELSSDVDIYTAMKIEDLEDYVQNLKKVFGVFLNSPDFKNYEVFKSAVQKDPLILGFKAKIVRVNDSVLKEIHSDILELISKEISS